MKLPTIAALLLATLALAAPSSNPDAAKRSCTTPSAGQVHQAIVNWRNDVIGVNSFLNAVPPVGSQQLISAAKTTHATAKDEPTELGILGAICELNQPSDSAYFGAVQTLETQFQDVLDNLVDILVLPGSQSNVEAHVNNINQVRCCAVLPSVGVLLPAAAALFSLDIATDVPRPNACAQITC